MIPEVVDAGVSRLPNVQLLRRHGRRGHACRPIDGVVQQLSEGGDCKALWMSQRRVKDTPTAGTLMGPGDGLWLVGFRDPTKH